MFIFRCDWNMGLWSLQIGYYWCLMLLNLSFRIKVLLMCHCFRNKKNILDIILCINTLFRPAFPDVSPPFSHRCHSFLQTMKHHGHKNLTVTSLARGHLMNQWASEDRSVCCWSSETTQWLNVPDPPPVCVHTHTHKHVNTHADMHRGRMRVSGARLAYRTRELCLKENGHPSHWTGGVMSPFKWSLFALVFFSSSPTPFKQVPVSSICLFVSLCRPHLPSKHMHLFITRAKICFFFNLVMK